MNLVLRSDSGYQARLEALFAPSSLFDPAIEGRVREIITAVRRDGDAALVELTERFDGAKLDPSQFAVSTAERLAASVQADDALREAVAVSSKNISYFCRKSLRHSWMGVNAQGGRVGERFDPIDRVGIYVPGGTAPLVSTSLMTALLAKAAGCSEIVVCTPCNRAGALSPAMIFALTQAGATEIYKVGGAQAIAAMALGTATIRRTRKIFGPGNAYVVAAKRLLFGQVGVDLLPGPSELLVIADDNANPAFIAADMLAQAEHGSGHERVWLATPSRSLPGRVDREIGKQLKKLARRELAQNALEKNGWLIEVRDLAEAAELANRLAPEHCEIMCKNAAAVAKEVRAAGAIFIGSYSPTALGDYVAGPSHVLPTGGAGVGFGGLTVDQFQRRTSIVEYDARALKKSLPALSTLTEVEGLDAHARSAAIRIERRP